MSRPRPSSTSRALWIVILLGLLIWRLPSLAEPMGGDQGLYAYAGERIEAGGVPYRDAWDQKPPGIMFVYAGLWRLWPHESVVAAADLGASALTAWLLVLLGRRVGRDSVGFGAAAIFLLFGNPWLSRLSGLYVRAQCETFITVAVAAALLSVSGRTPSRARLVAAGVALGVACWLKYNAAAYAAPIALALLARPDRRPGLLRDLSWVIAGALAVTVVVLTYFAAHGALMDLRLATIDYNLRYSEETYSGPFGALAYVVTLPFARARVEFIWFIGLLGAFLLVTARAGWRTALVPIAWLAAALVSIAVNGHRDLPQYFTQAQAPLALCAAAGLAALTTRPRWIAAGVAMALAAGLWRVGDEGRALRLGGLPQAIDNFRFDLAAWRGQMDEAAYLARFAGPKYDATEVAGLRAFVTSRTAPTDPILIFGFAGGTVCATSDRPSASRFFWSRPVVMEFAAERPGYGSAGLLQDLVLHPPAVVALQKLDWRPSQPNSEEFFLGNPGLSAWLRAGYVLDHDTALFSVWRRRSPA